MVHILVNIYNYIITSGGPGALIHITKYNKKGCSNKKNQNLTNKLSTLATLDNLIIIKLIIKVIIIIIN